MRAVLASFVAAFLCVAPLAWAQDDTPGLDLPGVSSDASAYERQLEARVPGGGTDKSRVKADSAVEAAASSGDAAALVAAIEKRVALRNVPVETWQSLADAQMRRSPPDPRHALAAAWLAYQQAQDDVKLQVPALLRMAEALRALGRDAQAAQALRQLVQRAPNEMPYRRMLADAERAAGLTVAHVTVEGEADPPRGCITFDVPPSRAPDFLPADWIRLAPAVPGAAITREGNQICVSGLPSGHSVQATLRAGLPAERRDQSVALTLSHETTVTFDVPDRLPRVVFDTNRFILPRGQAPTVGLTTVNLSTVSLRLIRVSERNAAAFARNRKLGESLGSDEADYIGSDIGRLAWEGRADIPHWEQNKPAHTALPLPPPLLASEPGIYALVVRAGDGTRMESSGAVQLIIRTDLAPTVWRGADGLTIQVRGYGDAGIRPSTHLRLLARNNDVLGEADTDGDGVARFGSPLLHGDGPLAPALVEAFGAGSDYAVIDLNGAAFDLSDRGVSGADHPGPLDGFIWTDRGIYRPAETVHVQALLRTDAGEPANIAAELRVLRPNGTVFLKTTPPRLGGSSLHVPVSLSSAAAIGTWTIELRADPSAAPIGRGSFRVDAFVPDRMAVTFGTLPSALIPSQPAALPITARFLYGAPGVGLSGHGYVSFGIDSSPFPGWAGYRFGLEDEAFAPQQQNRELPATDAKGQTLYTPDLSQLPDSTHPLRADVVAEINDPAGHGSKVETIIPVRSSSPLIGIKPGFAGNEIDANTEAAFEVVALSPEGSRRTLPVRVRLVREQPSWRLAIRGRLASYEVVYRDEPLETQTETLDANRPLRVTRTLPFGRYRLEVGEVGGLAVTSVRFRSGWADTDNPDVPDRVDVSTATNSVAAGGIAHVHIAAPFAGPATLLVLTDRVHLVRNIELPAEGTDVTVPVDSAWGPGAYVAVHAFRRAEGSGARADHLPGRAIGLTWVGVDPAARTLPVAIESDEEIPPRSHPNVVIRTAPGAWVTLAAVDEGILRLTRFETPDPARHFLGRRRLGLDIRDDWGRLIAPTDGAATLLRQGGDEGSFVLPDVPIRTVTLFAGPVQAGADGRAVVPLDMPDFAGQVRLMAVAWEGARVGAASRDVLVRDKLIAEPLLPRFLAPGDTTRFSVLLQDLDLPAGHVDVRLTAGGPLSFDVASLATEIAPGPQTVLSTPLHANGAGRGTIKIEVAGPGGFAVTRQVAMTVRSSRGRTAFTASSEISPGASRSAAAPMPIDRFVPGTTQVTARWGAPVQYDPASLLQSLQDYPLSCLEQLSSKALALVTRPDVQQAELAGTVSSILDRQRFDGSFALWSSNGESEEWLSAYAMDVLGRARDRGIAVGDAAYADGLKNLAEQAGREWSDPADISAQAYRLYVLARNGQGLAGAARVLAAAEDTLPTPLARAQVAASLALMHDPERASRLFDAAVSDTNRQWWPQDYGTSVRDEAAALVLLKESGLRPDRVDELAASLPGRDLDPNTLSTQEQAWLVAAAGSLGRGAKPVQISIDGLAVAPLEDGTAQASLSGPAAVHNGGERPVRQSITITGLLRDPPAAARHDMRVSRHFFSLDGRALDLDHLSQNTVFILVLEGRAEDGQDHRAMLLQGLPAGWEIASRLSAGKQEEAFLPELTATEAEPAADDRYAAIVDLTPAKPDFHVAVRLRATTPGDYEIPGAELSDMYRPTIFARQTANRIVVRDAP